MNVQQIKEIAAKKGISASKLKKADMIRAIQRSEGNPDCFGTGQADKCGQTNCLWRDDCTC